MYYQSNCATGNIFFPFLFSPSITKKKRLPTLRRLPCRHRRTQCVSESGTIPSVHFLFPHITLNRSHPPNPVPTPSAAASSRALGALFASWCVGCWHETVMQSANQKGISGKSLFRCWPLSVPRAPALETSSIAPSILPSRRL